MTWTVPKWFRDWRVAEILGLVLAILALVVGLYHLKGFFAVSGGLSSLR